MKLKAKSTQIAFDGLTTFIEGKIYNTARTFPHNELLATGEDDRYHILPNHKEERDGKQGWAHKFEELK